MSVPPNWMPLSPLLGALHYMHSHSIVHGDIAPDNIMLREPDKQPVLIDLGAVSYIDSASIGCLMDIHRLLQDKAGAVKLSGLQPRVETMISMTGVHKIIDIHPHARWTHFMLLDYPNLDGRTRTFNGYFDKVRHDRYSKTIQRTVRLHAHDETNDAKVGDRVRVQETRPLSKLKRWRLVEILERAR